MKIIIVGCTHAGTAAAVNLAKEYPEAIITVYERNDNISFLSCGIALYVGDVIKNPKGLFYSSPEALSNLGIATRMRHDVQDINLDTKTITVRNLDSEEVFHDSFDKIVVTTGSWPIVPKIQGIELSNILLCKNWNHANEIIESTVSAKNVAVIGAGYIGVELAEAFELKGKKVTLVDAENRIMPKYLDKEFTDLAEKEFLDHGIRLALGQKVLHFEGSNGKVNKVITDRSETEADLVIVCIGFRPNTELL
ncbi:MAG: FAD-dependent oxidoreductase, partial [Vallitaleaceae bacterium]|nr:FAD-dependent oxidoreductase [Vallitaleaceae bacterium]